jgi:hypothetical protein
MNYYERQLLYNLKLLAGWLVCIAGALLSQVLNQIPNQKIMNFDF